MCYMGDLNNCWCSFLSLTKHPTLKKESLVICVVDSKRSSSQRWHSNEKHFRFFFPKIAIFVCRIVFEQNVPVRSTKKGTARSYMVRTHLFIRNSLKLSEMQQKSNVDQNFEKNCPNPISALSNVFFYAWGMTT